MTTIASSATALAIRNLTVALPRGSDRLHAVEDVTLTVGRGEIVCLLGESGSGKSVIAQTVMGLLPREVRPIRGEVLLDGTNLLAATPAYLQHLRGARMTMIFQEPMTALNPVMTAGAQLDELLAFHTQETASERRARIFKMFDKVRLADPSRMYACISASAVWRSASTHHDCHGAGAETRAAHRR